MSFKKYATIVLLASLTSSTPNPDYEPIHSKINPKRLTTQISQQLAKHREIKPTTLLKQLLEKQIPAQDINGLKYTRQKHENNTYHIIQLNKDSDFNINITSTNTPKYLDELVRENEEIIAGINGSFFEDGRIIGLVKTKGDVINPNSRIRGSGYFTVQNGQTQILRELCDTTKYDEILQSHPMLLQDGDVMQVENGKRSYRSAIAEDAKGNTYLIITDTHPLRRNRVKLNEFAEFLESQKYTKALNLDGGKSAQAHFNNYNVRNHRRINNAITISRRNK